MNNIQKTFEEWEAILNPSEVEAYPRKILGWLAPEEVA